MPRPKKTPTVKVSFLPEAEQRPEYLVRKRAAVFMAVVIVIAAAAALATWYLRWQGEKFEQQSLSVQSAAQDAERAIAVREAQFTERSDIGRLQRFAKTLLSEHTVGEGVLAVLEATAVQGVVLSQLAADTKGVVVVTAQGSDAESVAAQLLAWQGHPRIVNVAASGVAVAVSREGTVSGFDFSAALTFDKEVFLWNP